MSDTDNERLARKQAKKFAALAYAITAALGVVLFELRSEAFSAFEYPTTVPYVSVILVAGIMGALLSGWYFPETGIFELVTVPVVVVCVAAVVAGQLFFFLAPLFEPEMDGSLKNQFSAGIYASIMYVYGSWPIVLPSAAVSSYFLWSKYRGAG